MSKKYSLKHRVLIQEEANWKELKAKSRNQYSQIRQLGAVLVELGVLSKEEADTHLRNKKTLKTIPPEINQKLVDFLKGTSSVSRVPWGDEAKKGKLTLSDLKRRFSAKGLAGVETGLAGLDDEANSKLTKLKTYDGKDNLAKADFAVVDEPFHPDSDWNPIKAWLANSRVDVPNEATKANIGSWTGDGENKSFPDLEGDKFEVGFSAEYGGGDQVITVTRGIPLATLKDQNHPIFAEGEALYNANYVEYYAAAVSGGSVGGGTSTTYDVIDAGGMKLEAKYQKNSGTSARLGAKGKKLTTKALKSIRKVLNQCEEAADFISGLPKPGAPANLAQVLTTLQSMDEAVPGQKHSLKSGSESGEISGKWKTAFVKTIQDIHTQLGACKTRTDLKIEIDGKDVDLSQKTPKEISAIYRVLGMNSDLSKPESILCEVNAILSHKIFHQTSEEDIKSMVDTILPIKDPEAIAEFIVSYCDQQPPVAGFVFGIGSPARLQAGEGGLQLHFLTKEALAQAARDGKLKMDNISQQSMKIQYTP